ncbi:UNVERIFIED_CONTAM: hypothetical protein Slati_0022100 [Sesamum latifolium]|uniref:Uncharacterized protein n=1 Tax=Sesamum latifolium TaxID=2727402 RepID=A0AAW2Y6E1_9LAMI
MPLELTRVGLSRSRTTSKQCLEPTCASPRGTASSAQMHQAPLKSPSSRHCLELASRGALSWTSAQSVA